MSTNGGHVTHIGWDESRGFDVGNLPDEWKSLFKAAGVKKRDLEDKETAKMIVEALVSNLTDEHLAAMPALPGITDKPHPPPLLHPPGPPPPQPPRFPPPKPPSMAQMAAVQSPIPPAPPPHTAFVSGSSAAIPGQPPALPPTLATLPAPPAPLVPPAPPVVQAPSVLPVSGAGRGDLLSQINAGGFKLKKVADNSPQTQQTGAAGNALVEGGGLMDALAGALAARRLARKDDDDDDDDDNDWE
mmetsp:Transcript_53003/g.88012  ORF Transcript_53003/g.88012 Transcript_53003/m.88012 type:complete len:244 (+) Transcript_53003:28-759(+)